MCRRPPAARGFTLVELLVVLALAGLMAGLVLPLGMRALTESARRAAVADLQALLVSFPLTASRSGRAIDVDAARLRTELPTLPDDCTITAARPLRYEANGMSRGGRVALNCSGSTWTYQITPLTGEVLVQRR